MKKSKFENVVTKHIEKLEQYVPIVERVHGESHPEFYEVRKSFDVINEEIKLDLDSNPKLESEFKKIQKATNNYTVPSDVCETYEAVYEMLKEINEAYQK